MDDLFKEAHWVWLTAGLLLIIAELAIPGFYLMWIGGAALLTGAITGLVGLSGPAQFVYFAVFTILSVLVAKRWFNNNEIISDDPLLNDRQARMIGEIVTVVEPITSGEGRVKIGDGVWTAYGADAPVGTRLRITGAGERGGVTVEPVVLIDQGRGLL